MPKQIETAKAIANSPQSEPPTWFCMYVCMYVCMYTCVCEFTDYLLFTVDCHQQIYRIFAIDSRLSPANLPNICYWQSTVTSTFTEYLLLTVDCHQPLRKIIENFIYIWTATWQNQQSDCAPSEDSDQPGHPPSLIRVFAVRLMGS